MKIEGFIVHKDIEGGFWGIQANDGRRFVPVNPLAERIPKRRTARHRGAVPCSGIERASMGRACTDSNPLISSSEFRANP